MGKKENVLGKSHFTASPLSAPTLPIAKANARNWLDKCSKSLTESTITGVCGLRTNWHAHPGQPKKLRGDPISYFVAVLILQVKFEYTNRHMTNQTAAVGFGTCCTW